MQLVRPILTICIFFGCSCVGPVKEFFPPTPKDPIRSVYVVTQAWHTGLAIAQKDIGQELIPERHAFQNYRYLEIGWGDRDFYMDAGESAVLASRAVLWPTDGAMHVVGFNKPVVKRFAHSKVVRVDLSQQGFDMLIDFIDRSFQREGGKLAPSLGRGLYGYSLFYPAKGTFHLFNTCNSWTAEALRSAGCPISTFYALTAGNVISQSKNFGTLVK